MLKLNPLILAALVVVILFNPKAYCQHKGLRTEALRLQRLQTAAEIWSRLFLAHPASFTNQLDFEQMLVDAIPSIEKAVTAEEFVDVLNEKFFYLLNERVKRQALVQADLSRVVTVVNPSARGTGGDCKPSIIQAPSGQVKTISSFSMPSPPC